MVLESVIFGLVAALAWGVADFASAVVSRRLGILRTAVGVHIVSIAVTTAYLLAVSCGGAQPCAPTSGVFAEQWATLAGLSVLGLVVYLCFYRALQIGPVAIVSPITSAYAVVVVLLALVLVGERLGGLQGIGVAASIGGIVLASVNLRGLRSRKELISVGVAFGLCAMLGSGLWQFSLGVLSREIGWFLPIYISRLFTLALLAPVSIIRGQWPWQRLTSTLLAGVALIGVFETGAQFAFARGAEVGIIAVVAAASSTYPILPVLGGLLILRERLALSQVAGMVITLAGLVMLGFSD